MLTCYRRALALATALLLYQTPPPLSTLFLIFFYYFSYSFNPSACSSLISCFLPLRDTICWFCLPFIFFLLYMVCWFIFCFLWLNRSFLFKYRCFRDGKPVPYRYLFQSPGEDGRPYEIYWKQVLNCNIVYLLLLHYYILPQKYPPVTATPCHPPLGKEGWRAVQSLSGDLWIEPMHTVWMEWFLMERELPYRHVWICFE